MLSLEKQFDEWAKLEEGKLNKEKINKKEFSRAKRSYLHFDLRRKSDIKNLKEKFLDQNYISQNGYWPFLKKVIKTPRIKNKKDSTGKVFRKKDPKIRDIYYASHFDSLIYSWYSFFLNNLYEEKIEKLNLDDCPVAYRKIKDNHGGGKSNINHAFEVFDFIRKKEECAVLVFDVSKFFDSLDHEILKKEWIGLLGVGGDKLPSDHYTIYKNLTKFKYVESDDIFKHLNIKFKKRKRKDKNGGVKIFNVPFRGSNIIRKICNDRKEFLEKIVLNGFIKGNNNKNDEGFACGIMQGAPISAVLSNIYMLSFDLDIKRKIDKFGGIYKRYSDDIVVVCDLDKLDYFQGYILENIKKYKLLINEEKVDVTIFKKNEQGCLRSFSDNALEVNSYKNLQYLGFEFNGSSLFIRSKSLANYYRNMKKKIRKSVNMAYGKKSKTKNNNNLVFKKKLFKKYLYKGRRSFISYASRAMKLENDMFSSDKIKKQLANRFKIMNNELQKRIARNKYKTKL